MMELRNVSNELKQKLLTAAYYIAEVKKREDIYNQFMDFVKAAFGISEDDLVLKKESGGLELGEKIRLITAAYERMIKFNLTPLDFAMVRDTLSEIDVVGISTINPISSLSTKGGIDFNANKMNLQLQNAGQEIKFYIDRAMLQRLQNASGFTPVIINIQPMNDLRMFLST